MFTFRQFFGDMTTFEMVFVYFDFTTGFTAFTVGNDDRKLGKTVFGGKFQMFGTLKAFSAVEDGSFYVA